MDSPLRSPLPDADDPIPPSPQKRNPILPARGEAPMGGSPLRSPLRIKEAPTPQKNPFNSQTDGRREGAMGSPLRSPIRDGGNPIPHRNSLNSQFAREGATGSLVRSPIYPREGAWGSPLRPPLRDAHSPIPLPPPQEKTEKPPPVSNRLLRDELAVVTKVEGGGEGGGGGGRVGTRVEGYDSVPDGVVPGIGRRRPAVRRAAVGLRVLAMVLSLVAFSVMAADKTKGWAGDSFDRYKEYRYCVAVNVIAFVYSGFQVYTQVHYMIKRRHIITRPIRYYFDFSMDQILAYLLISASSSAATRNDGWVSMFGSDDFTDMANGSIAMSFLAFVALALSSLISAYNLFHSSA